MRGIAPWLVGIALLPGTGWGAELRFGSPQTPAGAVAVVASELKVWDRHHVQVQALPFAAAINSRDAIVGGKLEIGIAGLANFIVGAAAADVVAIGVAVDQCASTSVMVRADSAIQAVPDLTGKRVGAQTGTVTHGAFVNRLLPKARLKAGDLAIVNLRFQDMLGALGAGSLDAVTAVDPFMSTAVHGGTGRVLTDFCPFSRVPLVLATSDGILRARGDEVAGFLRGWLDAARIFEGRPAYAAEVYGRSLKGRGYELPAEVIAQILRRLNVNADAVALSPPFIEFVKEEAQLMHTAGPLKQIPDWSRALRPALLRRYYAVVCPEVNSKG